MTPERLKQIAVLVTGKDGEREIISQSQELIALGWRQDEKDLTWSNGSFWQSEDGAHRSMLWEALRDSYNRVLELEAAARWIPVTPETLPKESCEILYVQADGRVYQGWFYPAHLPNVEFFLKTATHYYPLPLPPETTP